MFIKNVLIVFGIICSVNCGPIKQRREAFDPEKLMDRYMDMRTNQGLFGSYHPNDLVQSIIDYFSQGGKQSSTDNQWGLYVYNPSGKMTQYMGNLKSPGNLGPQMGDHKSKEEKDNSIGGFEFNPNALNNKLLNDALAKGSQFSNFGQKSEVQSKVGGQGSLVFDPNSLNQSLLGNFMNKGLVIGADNSRTTTPSADGNTTERTSTTSVQVKDSQVIGFNPDTLNAGLLKSFNLHSLDNSGKPILQSSTGNTNANILGFNPDQVNANLLSSLSYNPNSVSAAVSGKKLQGSKTNVQETSNQDNSLGASQLTGKATANNANVLTGNDDKNGGQTTGNVNFHVADEASNPFQTNVESGNSSGKSMFGVSKNGVVPASSLMTKSLTSGFEAGALGNQEVYSNQNEGSPPGVPIDSVLKQTEIAPAKVHGIGSMN